MSNIIGFRLRVGKDDDLEIALNALPNYLEKGDIIREALRSYFFDAPTPLKSTFSPQTQVPRLPASKTINTVPELKIASTKSNVTNTSDLDDLLNKSLGL